MMRADSNSLKQVSNLADEVQYDFLVLDKRFELGANELEEREYQQPLV